MDTLPAKVQQDAKAEASLLGIFEVVEESRQSIVGSVQVDVLQAFAGFRIQDFEHSSQTIANLCSTRRLMFAHPLRLSVYIISEMAFYSASEFPTFSLHILTAVSGPALSLLLKRVALMQL